MPLSKGNHSLVFLQAVEKIAADLKATATSYSEVIEKVNVREVDIELSKGFERYNIGFIPINKELEFYFELRAAGDLTNHGVYFTIAYKPESINAVSEKIYNHNSRGVLAIFKEWISIISAYNKISLTDEDRITAEAAQEFYDSFELVDEDAATAPFEEDKQIYLYRLLEYIKNKIEQDDAAESETAQQLVQEILLLEMRIPTATKAVVIKGLSQIYAKLKVVSFKIFIDSIDVLKKEIIKGVLYGGVHKVEQAIHYIQQLSHNQ